MIVPTDSIYMKYPAEDIIEKWNNIGCTTFSSPGMTDDDWDRVITVLND